MNTENYSSSRPSRLSTESLHDIAARLLNDFHNTLIKVPEYQEQYEDIKDTEGSIHTTFRLRNLIITVNAKKKARISTPEPNQLQLTCSDISDNSFCSVSINRTDDRYDDSWRMRSIFELSLEIDTPEAVDIAEATLRKLREAKLKEEPKEEEA